MTTQAAVSTGESTQQARRELLKILEGVRGKKTLVIEKSLLGPIGLFVKFSTLQEYGVEKLYVLENRNCQAAQKNVVLLARGEKPKQVQLVADQIKAIRAASQQEHTFSIIWLPRRTIVSDQILEENGVLGDVSVQHCPLYFTALEPDLLSLELEDAFADIYLHRDPTYIFLAANALMRLQKSIGLIPHIQGKGDNAKRLADLLLQMRREDDVNASADPSNTYLSSFGMVASSTVDSLVIVDRAVDFPTTLLTQLTYEGLIDEHFGIRYNATEVDAALLGALAQTPNSQSAASAGSTTTSSGVSKRKVQLDSTDKLYPQLRDSNFAVVGSQLSKVARRLQADYEARHKADQSISDLKSFVAKLPSYQAEQASLKIHTALAEDIMKMTRSSLFGRTLEMQQNLAAASDIGSLHDDLEELIARDTPLPTVLRLLCLESCLGNGIRQRDLEVLKRSVIHAYGPQHILTFARLEKMGLVVTRAPNVGYLNPIASAASNSTATDYNYARKSLKMFSDDVDESEPKDINYVFSGYAPLSVRLVQCAIQKSTIAELGSGSTIGSSRAAAAAAATSAFRSPLLGGGQSKGSAGSTNGASSANDSNPSRISQSARLGWKPYEDILGRIKGATFHHVQRPNDVEANRARTVLRGESGQQRPGMTSVVFYLGGITYAELAALRLVGRQLESQQKRKLIVATTGIISGDRVVEAAIEKRTFADLPAGSDASGADSRVTR